MAKEDELLTRYLSDNERYADLINGVSFNGRQVVKAEDLLERDTKTGYHKRTKAAFGKHNTKYRDLFRKTSFGANFMVIGVENQKQVHYLMPMRCMEYDLKEYQRQVAEQKKDFNNASDDNKNKTGAEFLSGFPKDGKLHPCITIVLYYGDDWDGSTDLHGLLDFTNIPQELLSMVGNYKINLLNIKKLKQTDMFCTDLKQVFDFIRYEKDKNKLMELVERDPAYKNIAVEAYDVIAAFTKSEGILPIEHQEEGGTVDMCQGLRELIEDYKAQGLMEGKIEGKADERLANLRAIMDNLKLTAEKAMDALNIPPEERAKYSELL